MLYEGYFNGYNHNSTVTSFSIAKSFVSALVGIAISEGYIGSIEDPITKYVPELLGKDPRYQTITLRHLLTMSSGIRYAEYKMPWSDDTATYYAPDLRAVAMSSPIASKPGQEFHYNNFHPLLLGLVLERATGWHVAQYLEEKIWKPLGMEAPGSWSLDSERNGFEKMESGINGRAIDFAKFGRPVRRHPGDYGNTEGSPKAAPVNAGVILTHWWMIFPGMCPSFAEPIINQMEVALKGSAVTLFLECPGCGLKSGHLHIGMGASGRALREAVKRGLLPSQVDEQWVPAWCPDCRRFTTAPLHEGEGVRGCSEPPPDGGEDRHAILHAQAIVALIRRHDHFLVNSWQRG